MTKEEKAEAIKTRKFKLFASQLPRKCHQGLQRDWTSLTCWIQVARGRSTRLIICCKNSSNCRVTMSTNSKLKEEM